MKYLALSLIFGSGHRIFIYDKELNKPVKIITIRDGKIDVRNLDKYDIKIK